MFDLWIASALVADGSGEPPYRASVGIADRHIASIVRGNDPMAPDAAGSIDAAGLVLAPGFVDVHNHSDLAPLLDPAMVSAIRQGVTTVIVGNCGMSPFPAGAAHELASWVIGDEAPTDLTFASFADLLTKIDEARPAVHVAALVGHSSIRELAMGLERRTPTTEELETMRRSVGDAMQAGAVGLSSGLIYVPGMFADTAEVTALAQETARHDGIYASHVRGEGRHLFRAIDEAIAIGRDAGLPAHVSHLKCETSYTWGRADDALARIHGGADVSSDQYPYAAWASSLSSLLPEWAPVDELSTLLQDLGVSARLERAVERGEGDAFQSSVDGVGWDRIVIESTADRSCNGLDIATIAEERGLAPVQACFRLLIDDPLTTCIGHAMREDDVRAILADPDVMVASDAVATDPMGPMAPVPVHPRTYGTFPRVLGPAVRAGTLTLQAAVRKMTSLPAERFGLAGRGRVAEGAWADLVLFDPGTVTDTATFGQPHRLPEGIECVIVEGTIAWRRGSDATERRGHVIRRGDP